MKLITQRNYISVTQRSLEEGNDFNIVTGFNVDGVQITPQKAEEIAKIVVTPISYKYTFEVKLNDQDV